MRNLFALLAALLLSAAAMVGGTSRRRRPTATPTASASQWNNGAALSSNLSADISANLGNDTRFWVDVRPV